MYAPFLETLMFYINMYAPFLKTCMHQVTHLHFQLDQLKISENKSYPNSWLQLRVKPITNPNQIKPKPVDPTIKIMNTSSHGTKGKLTKKSRQQSHGRK